MDNIQRLEEQADYIANNLTEWEAESIARIARKVGKIGKMSKSDAEKFDTEKEAKKEWEKIVAALAVAIALNIRSLPKAYTAEFEDWHKANKYLYDYRKIEFTEIAKNKQMQGIIDDFVKQNGKDIINLTNTKALRVLDRNGKPIRFQDEIYKAFSEAVGYVKDGRTDFYSAMRRTVQNLGGGGCKIDYGEGVTRRLDTVVRQNMMYGMKQAHKEYNALVGREIGADGIEIDYHSNSRPSHRYMQGKQYSKGEAKTINGVYYPSAEKEGVYARLYEDYNCYHYKTDIILGVSEPRYSAEELRRFEERDKKLYKIGDIEKDGYGWSQSMRAIETDIRKSKDEINALSALGGNEAKIKELKNRIKTFQGKYDEISDVTGIAKQPKRMSVPKSKNVLTNDTRRSIIKGEKEQSPRKMKTGDYAVNWEKVHNSEYREKLYKISKDEKVVSSIETRARRALNNRDGVNTEELYAISLDNGREISKITNQNYSQKVVRTKSFSQKLQDADAKGEKILLIHNHPQGLPPGFSDVNALLSNNNISGITVGHDGSVYYYTKPKKEIPEIDYNVKVRHFKQYDEITNLEKAMEELSKEFGFEFYKL